MRTVRIVGYVLLGLFLIVLGLAFWGVAIEPYMIDVEDVAAAIPSLPESWRGKRIAVISDFQVGMWGDNERTMRLVMERIRRENPALVLYLGDFIYHSLDRPQQEIERVMAIFRPLAEDLPVYATLGNHDYGMSSAGGDPVPALADSLVQRAQRLGIRVLVNEAVPLEDGLYLVGLGALWPGMTDVGKAFSEVPEGAPRFVMMHHPDAFARIPAGDAPFAVAGHTHGGQIRFPGTPSWSWLTFVKEDQVHVDGFIKEFGEAGNLLYVNRGVGFSVLPARINCAPEITMVTLEPAGAAAGGP